MFGSFFSTNEEVESTLAACSSSASERKKIEKENYFTSLVSSTPRRDDTNIEIVCKTIIIDDYEIKISLNSIKVRFFFCKNIEKKALEPS